eukprot:3652711-Amphidinium_carterae.1
MQPGMPTGVQGVSGQQYQQPPPQTPMQPGMMNDAEIEQKVSPTHLQILNTKRAMGPAYCPNINYYVRQCFASELDHQLNYGKSWF